MSMYGKIVDGKLIYAPNPLATEEVNKETGEISKYNVYNPLPTTYEAEGYLEIIETDYPTDDKYYEKQYVERDGKIYSEWVETEPPYHEPSLEERVAITESQITDTQLALCEVYEMLI